MMRGFTLYNAGRDRVGPSWSKDLTPYPFHRLYYAHGGAAVMETGQARLELTPGTFYLLPAFSVTSSFCQDFFDHSYINFSTAGDELRELWMFARDPIGLYMPSREQEIAAVIGRLNRTGHDATVSLSMQNEGAMNYLLAPFFTGYEEQRTPEALRKALRFMEGRMAGPVCLGDIARAAGYAPHYFSTLFRRHMGRPPMAYLLQRRLEQAQYLLVTTGLRIGEISGAVGIPDPLYFSRQFKKRTGLSPREYRRNQADAAGAKE